MNKHLLISLFLNVLLAFIYLIFFHKNQNFKDYVNLGETIQAANREAQFADRNAGAIIDRNRELRFNFIVDSVIQQTVQSFDSVHATVFQNAPNTLKTIENFDSSQGRIADIYTTGMKGIQREAKWTDKELGTKIKQAQNIILDSLALVDAFKKLPKQANITVNQSIEYFIRQAKGMFFNDVVPITYPCRRGLCLFKNFPLVISDNIAVVKKGEEFRATLVIGSFSGNAAKTSKIFINGKPLKLDNEGKGLFSLPPLSQPSEQQIEMVLEWTHPKTKVSKRDTSLSKYWVISN